MISITEQIKQFEEELRKTKYNKRTQHHIGLVKAKIARLKEKQIRKIKGKGKSEGYGVRKTGDATIIIVGFPSVGKSTLLNRLTNAESKVADYAFTTLSVIPGLLEYKGAKIQILDVPGILRGAADGTGRGKEVLGVMRNADLVLIVVDINQINQIDIIKKEIFDVDIRLNQRKPNVKIKRTERGGIRIGKTVSLEIMDETIKSILKEFKINNADILIREKINEDQLIDCVEGNKMYIPGLIALNKIDLINEEKIKQVMKESNADIAISAEKGINLDNLKELIFKKLNFIRIYLKEPGKKADMSKPMIMRKNFLLKDLCLKLHKDFINKFRFARIWGKSVKFDGMMIKRLDHKLEDGDIVEIRIR
jgi:hypothetical protein